MLVTGCMIETHHGSAVCKNHRKAPSSWRLLRHKLWLKGVVARKSIAPDGSPWWVIAVCKRVSRVFCFNLFILLVVLKTIIAMAELLGTSSTRSYGQKIDCEPLNSPCLGVHTGFTWAILLRMRVHRKNSRSNLKWKCTTKSKSEAMLFLASVGKWRLWNRQKEKKSDIFNGILLTLFW